MDWQGRTQDTPAIAVSLHRAFKSSREYRAHRGANELRRAVFGDGGFDQSDDNICLRVPTAETFRAQEFHLPIFMRGNLGREVRGVGLARANSGLRRFAVLFIEHFNQVVDIARTTERMNSGAPCSAMAALTRAMTISACASPPPKHSAPKSYTFRSAPACRSGSKMSFSLQVSVS